MASYFIKTAPHVANGLHYLVNERNKAEKLVCNERGRQFKPRAKQVALEFALVVYACVMPIFAIFDFMYTFAMSKRQFVKLDGGCDNLFSSNLIFEYKQKLNSDFQACLNELPEIKKEIVSGNGQSQLNRTLLAFQKTLEQDLNTQENNAKRKVWFKDMSDAFRKLAHTVDIAKDKDGDDVRHLLQKWSYRRYLEQNLLGSLEQLHDRYSVNLSMKDIPMIYGKMLNDSTLKTDGVVLELFDAHYFGNIPFTLPEIMLESGQKVRMIRMPSITKDLTRSRLTGSTKSVAVIEEFRWFMKALSSKGEQHLYVNLMNRCHGNEAIRSQAIEALDQCEGSPICVLTLDKDSDFYMQKGKFNIESIDTITFKEQFFKQMTALNKGYYLPKGTLKSEIKKIIESVHSDIYKDLTKLNRTERLNFIEITYCRVIEKLASQHKVNSMNLSCKHCIDRGASQNVMFIDYLQSQGRAEISDKALMTILLSPSILVANRPPRKHYMERAHLIHQKLRG